MYLETTISRNEKHQTMGWGECKPSLNPISGELCLHAERTVITLSRAETIALAMHLQMGWPSIPEI